VRHAGQDAEGEAPGEVERLLGGWDVAAARRPQKRSVAIAGHRTSISLEAPFWDGLRELASAEGVPLAALIAAIDKVRDDVSLSTAIRLFVYAKQIQRRANLA
jgi:predicted DNA-binding ribbon-helix-helix protein